MTAWPKITGSCVALVTPLALNGEVDKPALRRLLDFHLKEGTDAFVMVGTTGESPSMEIEEHVDIIRIAVEHCAGRAPVIAGTGANSTREAVALTLAAKKAGADAGLSVVPYYNKPGQQGLYEHFRAVAESSDLPLILYNVPSRTIADLHNETVLRLAELPQVVGLKDATCDMKRAAELVRHVSKNFTLYAGDDASSLAFMCLGGEGVISVTANVAPRRMHEMCAAILAGDITRARAINDTLQNLHQLQSLEANPIPIKWAVARMGLIAGPWLRLPLTTLDAKHHSAMESAMAQAGITLRA